MAPSYNNSTTITQTSGNGRACSTTDSSSSDITISSSWSYLSDYTITSSTSGCRKRVINSTDSSFSRRPRNRKEKRAIAKKILKSIELKRLKSSWTEKINQPKQDTQQKQPMYLNHKINSDRGQ